MNLFTPKERAAMLAAFGKMSSHDQITIAYLIRARAAAHRREKRAAKNEQAPKSASKSK